MNTAGPTLPAKIFRVFGLTPPVSRALVTTVKYFDAQTDTRIPLVVKFVFPGHLWHDLVIEPFTPGLFAIA